MKTASAKAKGRRLQQLVRDTLRAIGKQVGLQEGDIESRGMGQSGVDVILSPAAFETFGLAIECKNVEKLNVADTFWKHFNLYEGKALPILVHSRNKSKPLVTLRWEDFSRWVEWKTAKERAARAVSGQREQTIAA